MPTTKIIYERNFMIAPYIYEKLTQEYTVYEGESMTNDQIRRSLKNEIEEWHKKTNPGLYTESGLPVQIKNMPVPDIQVDDSADEKNILNQIRDIAKVCNYNSFQQWLNVHFPEYENHIIVKTILKSKQVK